MKIRSNSELDSVSSQRSSQPKKGGLEELAPELLRVLLRVEELPPEVVHLSRVSERRKIGHYSKRNILNKACCKCCLFKG